jgi:hypothetical protein
MLVMRRLADGPWSYVLVAVALGVCCGGPLVAVALAATGAGALAALGGAPLLAAAVGAVGVLVGAALIVQRRIRRAAPVCAASSAREERDG